MSKESVIESSAADTKLVVEHVSMIFTRDGKSMPVLEDIDLLSFLAGNAQLVAARIDRSRDLADLARAAQRIEPQIRLLRRQGSRWTSCAKSCPISTGACT